MTKFRPCIDLHSGQVKQIVGATLTSESADLKTNYISKLPAAHFAKLYKDHRLEGAHVIMLGPGNEIASKEALAEWEGGLQIGGGITDQNAKQWIDWGAQKVCPLLHHCARASLPPSLETRYVHNSQSLIEVVGYSHVLSISFREVLAGAPQVRTRFS